MCTGCAECGQPGQHCETCGCNPADVSLSERTCGVLGRFSANHVHAVPDDYVTELTALCKYLDIDMDVIGSIA